MLAAEDPTDPQPPWALQRQTHSWDRLLRASLLQLSKTASPPVSKTLTLPIAEGVVYCAWLTYLFLHHPPPPTTTTTTHNRHHSQQPVLSSQPWCRKRPRKDARLCSPGLPSSVLTNSFFQREIIGTGDLAVLRRYSTGWKASSRHEIGWTPYLPQEVEAVDG